MNLALLLYQLGSSDRIEYGSGQKGLLDARKYALADLHEVRDFAGWQFSEIVSSMLV